MLPHVLVLAAGASSRLGQPKQLVRLGGRPALHIVVSHAASLSGKSVTVVVGSNAAALMPMLAQSQVSVAVNRQWQEGLSSSIRAGLAALPPACEAVLIVLGDQVGLTADDLKRLTSAWGGDEGTIAASVYAQHLGVPAIFPRICFPELAVLRGDQGARAILERNSYRVTRVPMPNAAIDLDTPEDLAVLTRSFADKE